MATKMNIFDILHRLNTKEGKYYSETSDEERKQIQPFVLMRWMSGTSNAQQIVLLNEFANPYVFSLYKDKEIQWQLLTTCAPGKFKKYNWIKPPSQATSKKPLSIKVLKDRFRYSDSKANSALPLTTGQYLMEQAEYLGWQEAEIIKLGKEWDIVIKATRGSKKLVDREAGEEIAEEVVSTSNLNDLLEF